MLLAVFCITNGDQDLGLKYLREARVEAPSYPMPPLMLGQLFILHLTFQTGIVRFW